MTRFINRLPYLLCYLVAFALGLKQLREPDVWWQLLSGRWMIEHGQVTRTDMFSFTMAGHSWVNVKWLYEIIIGLLEKMTGPEGVILLQACVNVTIVYLLFRIIKLFCEQLKQPVSDFAIALGALLFLALVEYRMASRPEMVSHLMCTVYLFIIWRNPTLQWKKIWVLVLLQCIWANMHEGYPVGMVMIGTLIAGNFIAFILNKDKAYLQQAIRAAIVFAAAGIAILANPNTVQLWKQPFEIYRQVWANKYTTELYSVSNPDYWTIQAKWHVALLAAVCLFWIERFVVGIKNKSNKVLTTPTAITYLLLIPLFGYLSLDANRNIPFSQIILYPSVVYMLVWTAGSLKLQNISLYQLVSKRSIAIISIAAVIFYVSIITNSYYKATASPNRYGIHVSMLHNPTGAAEFIKANKIKGPAFSDYFVSSYLLWSLYPQFKSYIDLRDLDVFPVPFFDDYFDMYNNPQKFDSLDKIYHFNYIVFSNSQLPSLQQKLYWGEGYNLLYADPVSSIYLKTNKENHEMNHDPSLHKLFSWPAATEDPAWALLLTKLLNPVSSYPEEDETLTPIHAAKYYNQLRNFPVSERILKPAMIDLADNAEANNIMGRTMMDYASVVGDHAEHKNKLDSAKMYFNKSIELDNKMGDNYAALGDIAMMQNDFIGAREYYTTSLNIDNSSYGVHFYSALASYYLMQKSNTPEYRKDAIKHLEKTIQLNPEFKRPYIYLAEVYFKDGQNDKARKHAKKALAMPDKVYKEEQALLDELKKKLNIN